LRFIIIFAPQNSKKIMLIIDARENDSLDKALKVYKKKYEKAGIIKELRSRQAFTKKSITRRSEILKASYIESIRKSED
jgi:small subunit ribosomal protein S21